MECSGCGADITAQEFDITVDGLPMCVACAQMQLAYFSAAERMQYGMISEQEAAAFQDIIYDPLTGEYIHPEDVDGSN